MGLVRGDVVSAGRTRFERSYALPYQVLQRDVIERDVPGPEARRLLVTHATRALRIGTASDIPDYFRLKSTETMPALCELVDEGTLVPVHVNGCTRAGRPETAYLHRDVRIPRRIDATALLSPFDPVVWNRARAHQRHPGRSRRPQE